MTKIKSRTIIRLSRYLEFVELALRDDPPDMRLDLDDSPHLLGVHPAYQVATAARLQVHNVSAQVSEPVRQYTRAHQGLQTHVADPHTLIPPALSPAHPVLLDNHCGCLHPQEPRNNFMKSGKTN